MSSQLPAWFDRKIIKEKIKKWLNSNEPQYLISVSDEQEIEDVCQWMTGQCKFNSFDSAISYMDSSTVVTKHGLLYNIADSLGLNRFPKLQKKDELYRNIETQQLMPNVVVNQTMGENIESRDGNFNLNENTQIVNLGNIDHAAALSEYLDTHITDTFGIFLEEIKQIANSKKVVVICRFIGKYGDIDGAFKKWFQDTFLRKITAIRNIKVCIVYQQDYLALERQINNSCRTKLAQLHLDDILVEQIPFIEQYHGFCKGMVDASSSEVNYTIYKSKVYIEYENNSNP